MKNLRIKLAGLVAVVFTALAVLAASPLVHAANQGQIAGGDIYRVKNVTKGGDFANTASADACDTLQYKVRMHNPGPGIVHQVHVTVSLPSAAATSNTSTATITSVDGAPSTTTDTAVVNLSSSQSITYQSGSTQLLDANNGVIKGLPDGITQGGVDIGEVGVSLNEIRFVQFTAKVNCPQQPPAQPSYECTLLDVKANQDRSVNITAFTTAQANGATFDSAVIDWGDSSSPLTTAQVVGQTHTYEKAGTYTIAATARFKVNNEIKTSTSPSCRKTVTFQEKNKPPVVTNTTTNINTNTNNNNNSSNVTVGGSGGGASQLNVGSSAPAQAAPTSLVNTGPGELLGIFSGTSILGALGYNRFLSRRLRA